jgi:hypothetical protein
MPPSILYAFVRLLLGLLLVRSRPAVARDVELLALRQEVRALRRRAKRVRWQPGDGLVLAGLSRLLPRSGWPRFPLRPETLLRRHRGLVRRRWAAFGRRRGPGRPRLPDDVRVDRPPGPRELRLGLPADPGRTAQARPPHRGDDDLVRIAATTIRSVLRRRGIPPAPRRAGLSWQAFPRAQARGVLACSLLCIRFRAPPRSSCGAR